MDSNTYSTPTKKLVTKNPTSRFVDTHNKNLASKLVNQYSHKECNAILKFYQHKCRKEDILEANALFKNAKLLVKYFFQELEEIRENIQRIEEENPDYNIMNSMPLHKFEQLSLPIQNKFESMDKRTKKYVMKMIEKNHTAWSECYMGRWLYRSNCEFNRDSGHIAAFYIFKSATLISKIIKNMLP